jgi:O-antigen ligase
MLRDAQRWVLIFLCAALALPPLPVRLGDSGPHVAVAIAAIGLLAGIARGGEWTGRLAAIELALPAHAVVLLLSLAPAALYSGPEIALASLARVLLFCISIYVYFYAAHGPVSGPAANLEWRRALRWLFAAATASAAFACIDFYFQFPAPAGFGAQYVWLASGVYRRAQGVFYEASTLGNVCASFLVLIAVCLARRSESPIPRPALLAGGAALFAAMMLSFSRASLVNMAIALAILLWLERRRIAWARIAMALGVAASAGLAAMYWFAPQILEFYFARLQWSAELLAGGNTRALSGRIESWSYLAAFLAEHPWHVLLGVGYKTLPYTDVAGMPVVADNAYLSALVETGIAGLGAMLVASIAMLKLAWRAMRTGTGPAQLFGTWMLCFWAGQMVQMMSGDLLTYWRVLPVYFWALGMAVRYSSPALRNE